jgi:hypothetical protein
MARYGEAIYGRVAYGDSAANNATYTVSFTATPNWYNSILVEWGGLKELAAEAKITYWRLVRSSTGTPDHPDHGEYLTGGEYRAGGLSAGAIIPWSGYYLDNLDNSVLNGVPSLNSFPGNIQVSYSLWVFNGTSWRVVGKDEASVVSSQVDTLSSMLRMLPGAWVSPGTTGYATGEPDTDTHLAYFIKGFAFYYDRLRASTDLLAAYGNPMYAPSQLLKQTVPDIGYTDESAVGDIYNRSMYKVGHLVNAYKGTDLGLRAYATALTHCGVTTAVGDNLFLSYNDSSFEDGIDNWQAETGNLSVKAYSAFNTTTNIYSRIVTAPALPLQRTDGYFARSVGFGSLSLVVGEGLIACGAANPVITGIPVVPGKDYVFSVYLAAGLAAGAMGVTTLAIELRDKYGVYISTNTSADITTITTSWQKYELTLPKLPLDTSVALVDFVVRVTGGGATTQYLLIDHAYFGAQDTAEHFEDARTIHVNLAGERTNLLPNPGFDYSAGGWSTVNTQGQIVQSTSITPTFGTFVGKVVSTGTGPCTVLSDWIPVNGDKPLTFSVRANTSRTASSLAIVGLEFSSPLLELDQEKLVDGKFAVQNYKEESSPFDVSFEHDLFLTTQTPEVSKYGVAPYVRAYVSFTDVAINDEFYIDAAILEETGSPAPFFQGDGAPLPADPSTSRVLASTDCVWEHGIIRNYVINTSFETDTTGWANVTRITTDNKVGSAVACGEVSAGVTASTVVAPPNSVYDGSDVVASMYVKGAGTYTLVVSDTQSTITTTHVITEAGWVRISSAAIYDSAAGIVTISVTPTAVAKIDGVQLEAGVTCPSAWTGPGSAGYATITETAGEVPTNHWARYGDLESGRSFYWTNFNSKVVRLNSSLDSVLPMGSTWELGYGDTSYRKVGGMAISKGYRDSFETSLQGWGAGGVTSFSRIIAAGSTSSDYTVEGSKYAELVMAAAGTCSAFTDFIDVSIYQNYHLCAAVRSSTLSPITITAWLYVNSADAAPTSYTTTLTPTTTTDWYYLSIKTGTPAMPVFNSGANRLMTIEVATTAATGTVLDIDRVVLRPI